MKFGKLVATNGLAISNDEIEMWRHFIQDSFEKFGINIEHTHTDYVEHNVKYPYTSDHVNFTFKVNGIPSETRDCDKNRIFNLSEIAFMLHKETGYLDETDWTKSMVEYKHNYDDAPQFQWTLSIMVNGKMIEYRCRTTTGINLPHCYQYGTELFDFDFSDIAKYLRYMIKD